MADKTALVSYFWKLINGRQAAKSRDANSAVTVFCALTVGSRYGSGEAQKIRIAHSYIAAVPSKK